MMCKNNKKAKGKGTVGPSASTCDSPGLPPPSSKTDYGEIFADNDQFPESSDDGYMDDYDLEKCLSEETAEDMLKEI